MMNFVRNVCKSRVYLGKFACPYTSLRTFQTVVRNGILHRLGRSTSLRVRLKMTILGIGSAGLVYSQGWKPLWSSARCEGPSLTVTEGGEDDTEETKLEGNRDLSLEVLSLSDLIELIKPDIGWLIVAVGVKWIALT